MIQKVNELNFESKKIAMIIAGVPGIGKTTLALSSPKPLLVDLDDGLDRVEASFRKDRIVCKDYDELMSDLNTDLSDYETIVIDTGGKLLNFLKPVVIKQDAKNGQRNGELSLKGYGAVKKLFSNFVNFVKGKNKNLIMIFHASEVNLSNDVVGLRIRIEGSSKDEVWDDMDLGGFVEMIGNERHISFSNNDRFYAKGTHGITGSWKIPTLKVGSENNFITNLFAAYNNNLKQETDQYNAYLKVMEYKSTIDQLSTLESVKNAFKHIQEIEHILSSKTELWFALTEKAKSLGFKYDKTTNNFIE